MLRTSPSSAPLLVATLLVGILLGWVLDRLGPAVIAQAAPPARSSPGLAQPIPTSSLSPAPAVPASALSADDALYQQLDRQFDLFRHVNRSFELVAKAVAPSVVHIEASKVKLRDKESVPYRESGSGVIVRPGPGRELYVLTNDHVVQGATSAAIRITLHDGRVLRPERVWLDHQADIAVLRLDRSDLPAARLGDSDEAAVGSWVLAVGSPFGLTHSVTQGIISARGRHEPDLEAVGVVNQDFLQTDAAINPGNSGGPLVNLRGEVIGINTAIASKGGGSEGVGFSIPINLARWIMGQLVVHGKVSRGAMGIELETVKADRALELGLDRPRGAYVQGVKPNSPASRAGVRPYDVVLKYNGVEIQDYNHLINLLSMSPIGVSADIVLWRNRSQVATRVTIADRDLLPGMTEPLVETDAERPRNDREPDGYVRRPRPSAPPGPSRTLPSEAPAGSGPARSPIP